MAFDDTYRESIQTKHIANVGFTSTAKGVTNEGNALKNPHQVIASQIPAVDVVGTYGPLTADGITAGLVEQHTVKLTADPTVNNNKAWFATEDNCTTAGHSSRGSVRIEQWMRYANTQYKLRLYEDNGSGTAPNLSAEILPSEVAFNWEYDASTGIVYFDDDPSTNGKTTPLWGVVFTYVGDSVQDGLGASTSGIGDLVELFEDTNEPSGFVDQTSSALSFDDGTRTLTISGATWSYYIEGEKYTKTGAESIQITDVEGMHYLYYNDSTLTHTTGFTYDLIFNKAYVAAIYWDATNSTAVYVGDERHGITMDGQTHAYLHAAFGTQYIDGLGLTSILADEAGDNNTHQQLGVASGNIRDEDILHTISTMAAPASIPVFYKEGAAGNWRMDTATSLPAKGATTYLAWNEWTGATWTQNEVDGASDNLVLSHIFATNDINHPMIVVQGQAEYATLEDARVGATEEINNLVLTGLPFAEFIPVGTVIFQCASGYTTTYKCKIRSTTEGDDYVDWRFSGITPNPQSVTAHANLTGRDDANQHPATAISADFTNFDGALSSADDTVQKSLETLDDAVQSNTDAITALDAELTTASGVLQTQIDSNDTDIFNLTNTVSNNYTTLDNKIDTVSGTLHDEIVALGEAQDEFIELTDTMSSFTESRVLFESADAVVDDAAFTYVSGTQTLNVPNMDIDTNLDVGGDVDVIGNVDIDGTLGFDTGTTINEFVTEITAVSSDDQVPTAGATYEHVNTVSGVLQDAITALGDAQDEFLELTDTISSYNEGRILFESADAVIDDSALTYVSGTQTLNVPNISVVTDLVVGGSVDVTGNIDLDGTLAFDTGTSVNEFVTTVGAASTDDQVPTAKSVYDDVYTPLDTKIDTASGTLQTEITNNYNTLDTKIDTTSGTLQSEIDALDASLTDDIIWEVVDTPFEQIRPKVAHQGKAIYTAGNLTIGGDLTVSGTTTTVHSEELTVADKTITVNAGEAGAGITGDQYAGIEVDRGSEANYMFVFDEVQDNFRVGISGSLQAVATREDSPIDTRVPWWNESSVRFDTAGATYMTVVTTSGAGTITSVADGTVVASLTDDSQVYGTTAGGHFTGSATSARMDVGASPVFVATANLQRVGNVADTLIEINQSGNAMTFAAATTTEMTINTDGMSLKTGASVNEISTALSAASTDDQLATAKAIYDELMTISGTVSALTFLELTDTPSSYSDGYFIRSGVAGIEFDQYVDHNDDTDGKQGGTTDEYYHLTNNEYSAFSSDGSTWTFSQAMALATGTSVNEIVTTAITSANTDDQLATAKAIYTTISGMGIIDGTADNMLYINNSGDLATTANMTYDADGTVNVLALADTTQRLGNAATSFVGISDTEVTITEDSVEVIALTDTTQVMGVVSGTLMSMDQTADTVTFTADGTDELVISTAGLSLKSGADVNEILAEADGLSAASTDDQLATAALIWDEMTTMSGVIQTDIDAAIADLANNYYNKTELDSGQLDNRYYTETEIDAMISAQNEFLELTDVEVGSYTAGNILFTTASGVTDDDGFTFSAGTLSTTAITLGTGGSVNEIVTTVTSGTTDSQIPTAKAVWDLTEAAAAAVHIHYDVDATWVSDTSWTYGSGFSATPDGLQIYVNGVKQRIGSDYDCTVDVPAGVLTITFNYSVRTSDWVNVTYYA